MDIQKERSREALIEAFELEAEEIGMCLDQNWGDYENPYVNSDTALAFYLFEKGWNAKTQTLEGFVLAPKESKREGGYYLRDLRSPIGNCMKFWYTNGYGTKLEKFHWFPSLDAVLSSKGGADWFEPWYAPYIDSIAEKTVDFQLANRDEEKAMIKAAEE